MLVIILLIFLPTGKSEDLDCFVCDSENYPECAENQTAAAGNVFYKQKCPGQYCYLSLTLGYRDGHPGRLVNRQCLMFNPTKAAPCESDVEYKERNLFTRERVCYCTTSGCNNEDLSKVLMKQEYHEWKESFDTALKRARNPFLDDDLFCFQCDSLSDRACGDIKHSHFPGFPNWNKSPYYKLCLQGTCAMETTASVEKKINKRVIKRSCVTSTAKEECKVTKTTGDKTGSGDWSTTEVCNCRHNGCNAGDRSTYNAPVGWSYDKNDHKSTTVHCFQCNSANDKGCAEIKDSPSPDAPNYFKSPFYKQCSTGVCSIRTIVGVVVGKDTRVIIRECITTDKLDGCYLTDTPDYKPEGEWWKEEQCICSLDGCNGGDHSERMVGLEWKLGEKTKLLRCFECDTKKWEGCKLPEKRGASYVLCPYQACQVHVMFWNRDGKEGKFVERKCVNSKGPFVCDAYSSGATPGDPKKDWEWGKTCLCKTDGCNGLDYDKDEVLEHADVNREQRGAKRGDEPYVIEEEEEEEEKEEENDDSKGCTTQYSACTLALELLHLYLIYLYY